MKSSIVYYILGFLAILAILLLWGHRVSLLDWPARAGDITGPAEIQPKGAGDWRPLAMGEAVLPGSTLRTGATGEVDLGWQDGTHILLGANSIFHIMQAKTNATSKESSIEAELTSGKLWAQLRKSDLETNKIVITTPVVNATIPRSTTFSLALLPEGVARVETYQGTTETQVGKNEGRIHALEGATYGKGKKFAPSALLTAAERKAWLENRKVLGAFLSVAQPAEGAKSAGPVLQLSGYTDPGNAVEVNGVPAQTDKDGRWSSQISLKKGENLLTIHALDDEGRQRTITRKVIY